MTVTERDDLGAPARASGSNASRNGGRGPRTLRVGLLLDGFSSVSWVERVLREIRDAGFAELSLVVLNDAGAPSSAPVARRGLAQRARTWYRNRSLLPYALYERLDERRYGREGDPSRPADLTPLLQGVPVVRVRPRQTRFCDYFEETDLRTIAGHDLDVALRFGFRILKGDALRIARHGVWSFHHGDNTVNRGGPAGFWEVMERHETTGAVLQRLTEDLDGGEVLCRSYASTNPFSPTANRSNFYWQAAALLVPRLRSLAEQSGQEAAPPAPAPTWTAYDRRLYTRPRAGELLAHVPRLAWRLVRSKVRALTTREQWILAYHLSPAREAAGDVPHGVFYRYRELQPPADRYWADPFPVFTGGRHHVFFEEHRYGEPHAHIAVVEIDASGMVGTPRVVLQRPYHLSYPSVFEWDGAWYMTPESASRRAVELYRATRFPDEWEHVGDLVSGLPAVDPTIARIHGRWWMFVGVLIEGASEATALHLYSAASPLGPWTPHRGNPVKIDVRGARPGGRVFEVGGRYFRVGQDGAPSYGSGLRVFAIDELDDVTFRETEVSRITPAWRKGLVGMHTLNASGGLTVIDARQVRRRI